jgi:hypothetical protein
MPGSSAGVLAERLPDDWVPPTVEEMKVAVAAEAAKRYR